MLNYQLHSNKIHVHVAMAWCWKFRGLQTLIVFTFQVLTEDNVEALRGSVKTLTKTLEHVEAISGDVGGLTADSRVKANLKQLIEALSRLTTD